MLKKPIWISHRGYAKKAVENTRAAFRAAVDLGFSCLETDLRLTRDGRIALVHDPDLTRLAGDRRRVQDLTAAELAGIPLKYPDDTRPGLNTSGPSNNHLDDANSVMFFDAFASEFSECRWVLDIKPEAGDKTILALAHWAKAKGLVDKIIHNAKMLTWDARHQALASELFPGLQFYPRSLECWRAGLAALSGIPALGGIQTGKTYALPPTVSGLPLFRPSIVRHFHQRGASVVAFLPPCEITAGKAAAVGFDEILTNHEILPEAACGVCPI
ncbi:MAG: glycerophosphodiester phosphodiesterase family protein [Syntrophotaleaceae bacterium]